MAVHTLTPAQLQPDVVVSIEHIGGKPTVKFVFQGVFTARAAAKAVDQWKSVLQQLGARAGVTYVWDCQEMAGYEPDARLAWQKAMKEYRATTQTIWLVTTSRLIKAGAMILSTFTGYPIKTVSTEAEIVV